MPLDQLVAKYRQEGAKIKFDSPAIKSRKDDGAGPSTSKSGVMAGCSKSSEPSSSSSELTNGEVLVNGDKHEAECSKQQPEAS
ncbi:hypothetical protein GN156_27820, partial [bacterium LRH843]|nr:hypothetical protein [bacterium LRH843]